MEYSKEEIKNWVDAPGRGREWLAERCGAPNKPISPRTVSNWLTSSIDIPSKALRVIENLMREDESRRGGTEDLSHVVLRITTDELNEWSQAFKESDAKTLEEWAIQAIRTAYAEDSGDRKAGRVAGGKADAKSESDPVLDLLDQVEEEEARKNKLDA